MKKNKSKRIILWKDGKPALYCKKSYSYNEWDDQSQLLPNQWDVINGGWTLILNGLTGHVLNDETRKFTFDKMTTAPKVDGDYNAVMAAAEEQEKDSK